MSPECACSGKVCQGWPGPHTMMGRNMNKTLKSVKKVLWGKKGFVYAYKLSTTKIINGQFSQTGCGPNFCGNAITLCACKHRMRTGRKGIDFDDWVGNWVAGLTVVGPKDHKKDYLFYLMLVKKAFESHKDIWDALHTNMRQAKNARIHTCGDIYQPRPTLKSRYKYHDYYRPAPNHVHLPCNNWHKDIDYRGNGNRRPALLLGDRAFSFLWSVPMIYFGAEGRHPRMKRYEEIWDLIGLLV